MQSIDYQQDEINLLDYSIQKSTEFLEKKEKENNKGQIFTPKEVSIFMANLLEIKSEIRLLDCGAGTGNLTMAFCDRILREINNKTIKIFIDVYENDKEIIPYLKKTLNLCYESLSNKNHSVEVNVYDTDFILSNTVSLGKKNYKKYNTIISNPPYFKINKHSLHSEAMSDFVYGQPNIYSFFMALAVKMLKSNGEMVFITPRSFCSGRYFIKVRDYLLRKTMIEHIHIFESRNKVFDGNLQENIIFKAKKV